MSERAATPPHLDVSPTTGAHRIARHRADDFTGKADTGLPAGISPRKRFGQHFLQDPNILSRIVKAAEIEPGDLVLEIGPGLGDLTIALINAGARVVAVEVDRDLVKRLVSQWGDAQRLTILEGDILTMAPEQWLSEGGFGGLDYKVVANLPYNITSAVLRHLLEATLQPKLMVVMVQKQVAREITAIPDKMNLLAISVQFYSRPRVVADIPAGAFYPRPKVDSSILRLDVSRPSLYPDVKPDRFFELVRAAFGGRRKQLHNSLSHGLGLKKDDVSSRLLSAGVQPIRRAETLTLLEWREVYRRFQIPIHEISS